MITTAEDEFGPEVTPPPAVQCGEIVSKCSRAVSGRNKIIFIYALRSIIFYGKAAEAIHRNTCE